MIWICICMYFWKFRFINLHIKFIWINFHINTNEIEYIFKKFKFINFSIKIWKFKFKTRQYIGHVAKSKRQNNEVVKILTRPEFRFHDRAALSSRVRNEDAWDYHRWGCIIIRLKSWKSHGLKEWNRPLFSNQLKTLVQYRLRVLEAFTTKTKKILLHSLSV